MTRTASAAPHSSSFPVFVLVWDGDAASAGDGDAVSAGDDGVMFAGDGDAASARAGVTAFSQKIRTAINRRHQEWRISM